MKVKCKVCGEWFERENRYCDFCAAKYGAEKTRQEIESNTDIRGAERDLPSMKAQDLKQILLERRKEHKKSTDQKYEDTTHHSYEYDRKVNIPKKGRTAQKPPKTKSVWAIFITIFVILKLIGGFAGFVGHKIDVYRTGNAMNRSTIVEESVEVDSDDYMDISEDEEGVFFRGDGLIVDEHIVSIDLDPVGVYSGDMEIISIDQQSPTDAVWLEFDGVDGDEIVDEFEMRDIYVIIQKDLDINYVELTIYDRDTNEIIDSKTISRRTFDTGENVNSSVEDWVAIEHGDEYLELITLIDRGYELMVKLNLDKIRNIPSIE